jgi:imidazolonepropionase-like amidohydrolase
MADIENGKSAAHRQAFCIRLLAGLATALIAVSGLPSANAASLIIAGPASHATLFDNVRVFDGDRLLGTRDVLIRNGVIVRVARHIRLPSDCIQIVGKGLTLLPGLMDAHVHVFPSGPADAARFGVTTVFDLYTLVEPGKLAGWKRRRRSLAPSNEADVWSAGAGVTPPGGHPTEMMTDLPPGAPPIPLLGPTDDPAAFIAARVNEGSDFIKVIEDDGRRHPGDQAFLSSFGPQREAAVIKAAKASGLRVLIHAQQADAAKIAVDAGVDALAHAVADRVPTRTEIAAMARHNTVLIPTLAIYSGLAGGGMSAKLAAQPNVAPFLTPFQKIMLNVALPKPDPSQFAVALAHTRAAHLAGVTILAGTDAPNPTTAFGISLHQEMELLVQAGLTPSEALSAASAKVARFFGVMDRGKIIAGRRADLLLVKGDPTQDITVSRNIVGVWKNGARIVLKSH